MKYIILLRAFYKAFIRIYQYYVYPLLATYGYKDKTAKIETPTILVGTQNMYLHEGVDIGPQSILFAPHSKITIKRNSYTGPRLFVSTGNHYSKVGTYSRFLTYSDKEKDDIKLNWDVCIEEDVWIGANVSILCKKIGRGSIIAAGAVCKKDVPPYSVMGGGTC